MKKIVFLIITLTSIFVAPVMAQTSYRGKVVSCGIYNPATGGQLVIQIYGNTLNAQNEPNNLTDTRLYSFYIPINGDNSDVCKMALAQVMAAFNSQMPLFVRNYNGTFYSGQGTQTISGHLYTNGGYTSPVSEFEIYQELKE
jgi:hypothetical protein